MDLDILIDKWDEYTKTFVEETDTKRIMLKMSFPYFMEWLKDNYKSTLE